MEQVSSLKNSEKTLTLNEEAYHDGLNVMCYEPSAMREVINFLASLTDEELDEVWYLNVDITVKKEGDDDE